MANTLKDVERNCPSGKVVKPILEKVATLETEVAKLNAKLSAVLSATADDSGKSLTIDAEGKVALSS